MEKIIETNIPAYEQLKQCISEIYPQITIKLLDSDPALFHLGFVDKIPCTIKINATEEQVEELMDMIMEYEINAYNTPDGSYPKDTDPDYILYEKYGWIWDFLYYHFIDSND